MKEKKIKVNISISPKTKALAQDKIDMFGGNFSAYIAHLILQDVERNISKVSAPTAIGVGNVVATANSKIKNKTKLKK